MNFKPSSQLHQSLFHKFKVKSIMLDATEPIPIRWFYCPVINE